jgi:putative transposase
VRPEHIHPVHQHLELEGIAPSIGTVGDAYPNALMESIIGLFKTEAIATTVFHDGPYKALADVEYVAAGWVEVHRRLHGSLGWLTRSSTSRTTTLPSAESRNPHRGAAENP